MENVLGHLGLRALENRRISGETAIRYGLYTVRRVHPERPGVEPDFNGNVVAFPFIENGVEVGVKYRGANKTFWQRPGGKKTFWNADVLDDSAMRANGTSSLVITEGELDALSVLESGYPFVVSVPEGAPSVPKGKKPDQLDPLDPSGEDTGKFEFMWNNRDALAKIRRFVIAADADAPGQRLAAELVRRLSAARCAFITYPPDLVVPDGDKEKWPTGKRPCKDMNDVLVHFGPERVRRIIAEARPYPVRGVYKLADYPDREIQTYQTGFDGWGAALQVMLPEFMVVTGTPGSGKSTWVLHLVASLCSTHSWTCAIFGPEMPAVPYMRDLLRRWYLREKATLAEPEKMARADAWINRRFNFIDSDPTGYGDDDVPFDLNWVLERATDAVLRDGIRILVIDPWNELDHAKDRGETEPEYLARAIRALKRWAKLYEVLVIAVTHPTKEVSDKGKIRDPSLYEISGGAHWYNKSDHGITVSRNREKNITTIGIKKVKFEGVIGKVQDMTVRYDRDTGHYENVKSEDAPYYSEKNKDDPGDGLIPIG